MTTSEELNDSQGISGRVRNSLALARTQFEEIEQRTRAQWVNIPTQMREAVDGLMVRVRKTLDLPSRGEIADLISRIEDIDAKLADLESARAKAPVAEAKVAATPKKKPAPKTVKKTTKKAAAAKANTANKTVRKEQIAKAAKKANAKARKTKSKK